MRKIKESLNNPRCPYCKGIAQKQGKLRTVERLLQKYKCMDCGRTFSRLIVDYNGETKDGYEEGK